MTKDIIIETKIVQTITEGEGRADRHQISTSSRQGHSVYVAVLQKVGEF